MNKRYLFFVLVGFLCLPLTTAALYVPSEPFGSRNNPIYFQEVKPTDQIIRESQQGIWGAQQRADDTLNGILRDAVRNQNQLLQQNNLQHAPVYVPTVIPTPTSQQGSDSCPQNTFRFFEGGACLCGPGGYEWNADKTACVATSTVNTERLANWEKHYGTDASQQLPPTPMKENWRQKLSQWIANLLWGSI